MQPRAFEELNNFEFYLHLHYFLNLKVYKVRCLGMITAATLWIVPNPHTLDSP